VCKECCRNEADRGSRNRLLGRTVVPAPLCPPQIPTKNEYQLISFGMHSISTISALQNATQYSLVEMWQRFRRIVFFQFQGKPHGVKVFKIISVIIRVVRNGTGILTAFSHFTSNFVARTLVPNLQHSN